MSMGHGGREAVNRRCCHLKSFAVVGSFRLMTYRVIKHLSMYLLSFVFFYFLDGAHSLGLLFLFLANCILVFVPRLLPI